MNSVCHHKRFYDNLTAILFLQKITKKTCILLLFLLLSLVAVILHIFSANIKLKNFHPKAQSTKELKIMLMRCNCVSVYWL